MKNLTLITVLCIAAVLSNSPGRSQTGPESDRVKMTIAGSGANLAITRVLADAFEKSQTRIKINIPGSIGTRGAIKAVSDGAIALGLISRPLKEEEKALGLVSREYARVAIIIGAHPTVPDQDITSGELVAIYQGTKTRWQNGREIIVQAREKSDSGFLVLQNAIPGFKEAYTESQKANRWTLYFTDQDANQALAATPDAIGVSDLGMITAEHVRIKPLRLDGVAPSLENLENGTYPLSRSLAFIYKESALTEDAKAFFTFVSSQEGRKPFAGKRLSAGQIGTI
jgi:phosphate transport system substrate-binding protein